MPTIVRAQVSFPFVTGLPRDVVVNTFHFECAGLLARGEADEITFALNSFYNGDHGPGADGISQFMSSRVSRAANAGIIKYTELGDEEPKFVDPLTLSGISYPTAMPDEVALCLSFRGAAHDGVPKTRRRGRLYLGPFSTKALGGESARPHADLIAQAVGAGAALRDRPQLAAEGIKWCVYSRPWTQADKDRAVELRGGNGGIVHAASHTVIDTVWCDDAFDTQRRRGLTATSRVTDVAD